MLNSVVAASIEVLSLLIAEAVGVPILFHAHTSIDFVLVYTFGIACGGLGSRLSAIWRERVKRRRITLRRAA
jgi:hypothetical protein